MPRDVSGNYTLPSGVNPVVNNTLIDVAWANPTLSDIATQLNNVLTRDGLLGPILPLKLVDGTVGAPSLCFGSQPTTGFYKTASGFGFGISGTNVLNVTSTEFQIVGKTGIGSATGSNVGLYVYKSGSAGGTNDSGLFVRQDGTDPIAIFSGPVGAERMRITASGNIGIGIVPNCKLDLLGANNSINYGANGDFVIRSADQSVTTSYGWNQIACSDSIFLIGTGGAERIRVSNGFIYFGNTTASINPATGVTIIDPSGSTQVAFGHQSGTVNGTTFLNFNYNAGTIGNITQNGTTAVAYNTTSDYRLKNVIGDLQGSGAFIDALQPRVGTWKADGSPFVGFVAHELQSVSPMSVTGEKDGEQMQSVAYGSAELIANMVAELKSLRSRMSVLEQA